MLTVSIYALEFGLTTPQEKLSTTYDNLRDNYNIMTAGVDNIIIMHVGCMEPTSSTMVIEPSPTSRTKILLSGKVSCDYLAS